MNPILPNKYHIPDVEAHQWKDGRIYLYGSYDVSGDSFYCSFKYHVFSSDDLINWTDHGESFNSMDGRVRKLYLYAPDCAEKDGKYYMYYCQMDNAEGVAVSESPFGPFEDPQEIEIASGDAIDPSVFVDDDGRVYYFWGQFDLRGAELEPDMKTIKKETLQRSLLNEKEHGFHEGSSIRKRNGIYYMVYADTSRGKATCLGYATSKNPLGPYTKQGIIIDNDGCDVNTWNNHGSIAEFNGEWYVFYHRSSQGKNCNRRVCMEKIEFDENGLIKEVEMTTQGISGPIPATDWLDAWRACLVGGEIRTEQLELGEYFDEYLTNILPGTWAGYKYIDFGEEGVTAFEVESASATTGAVINICLDDPDSEPVGVIETSHTGGWHEWKIEEAKIEKITGVHAVYLKFSGWPGNRCNLRRFRWK